jgi:hypothetical protein
METEEIMNLEEAADFLRVSKSYWKKEAARRHENGLKAACLKLGRRVLFRRKGLEQWALSHLEVKINSENIEGK